MKKILALLFIAFFLVSCFNKEETKKETSTGTGVSVENEKLKVVYDGIEVDASKENLIKKRKEIQIKDLDMLFADETKTIENPLLEVGKKFIANINETKEFSITQKIDGGIEFEDYMKEVKKIPEDLRRDFVLKLKITDSDTGEKIKKGNIYMNGIKFGEFKDGEFEKKFVWPKGIEKFNMIVRTDDYADYFIDRNSINSEGELILAEVKLKKLSISKTIDLKNTEKIETKDFSMKIDNCSLVNSSGECHKGEVKAKINHLKGTDVNKNAEELGLNMKAITKEGEIVYLASGGMAFTDFITNDGEILKVKDGEKVTITYKVTDDDIRTMKYRLYGSGKNEGYWMYDKNKNLWVEKEAKYSLDEKNKTWTVETSDIY